MKPASSVYPDGRTTVQSKDDFEEVCANYSDRSSIKNERRSTSFPRTLEMAQDFGDPSPIRPLKQNKAEIEEKK